MANRIQSLYQSGFIPIEGIEYNQTIMNYLMDMKNYTLITQCDSYTGAVNTSLEIHDLNSEMTAEIYKGLPEDLKNDLGSLSLYCCVTVCEKGFTLAPHRDYYDVADGRLKTDGVAATLVLWIAPHEFEGREFVYGKLTEIDPDNRAPFDWHDPILKELGSIKPKTGLGILIDLFNPMWWHGVKPLLSGGPVIAISINLA